MIAIAVDPLALENVVTSDGEIALPLAAPKPLFVLGVIGAQSSFVPAIIVSFIRVSICRREGGGGRNLVTKEKNVIGADRLAGGTIYRFGGSSHRRLACGLPEANWNDLPVPGH